MRLGRVWLGAVVCGLVWYGEAFVAGGDKDVPARLPTSNKNTPAICAGVSVGELRFS